MDSIPPTRSLQDANAVIAIAAATLVCFLAVAGEPTANSGDLPGHTQSASNCETRKISGWTVHVSLALLGTNAPAVRRALELLSGQLEEIVRRVPLGAVAELRRVPLWVSPEYPGEKPRAEYHPDAGWLREHGRDPAMAKAVEFTNVRIFESEARRMPNFTLHELAHAYHDRVPPGGFDNSALKEAYEKAGSSAKCDHVEQRFGDGRSAYGRAYAMTNPMEYFAESTEAFFSTNDFFPFTRGELRRHDPEMFALLTKVWGVPETNQQRDLLRGTNGTGAGIQGKSTGTMPAAPSRSLRPTRP